MNPAIFKAYDVRGLCPEELDRAAASRIGHALATYLVQSGGPPGSIVVGRDMRESGIELREALVTALLAEGLDVIDVGRVTTPMVYYAVSALEAMGGVMITASHNPGAYNGLKICRESAIPIGIDSGLREIRDAALALEPGDRSGPRGSLREHSIREPYASALLGLFAPSRPLRVVIDAGNGIAGEAVEPVLAALPLEVERLYFEPDGSFPNHEADPIKPENLRDLQKAVVASGADLGVAFDGDGDRAVFVDETGESLPADLTTAVYARALAKTGLLGMSKGSKVAFDLRSSRAVAEEIRAVGGEPQRSRVGHAYIKLAMRESGAVFGGELSGHYYFRFPWGYVADDGIAAFLLLLRVLEVEDRPLSELWRPFRRYAQSGEVNRRVDDVEGTTRRVRGAYTDGECDELDGLTVQYDDWWFNLRPSNTEPLLRLNVEAATEGEMERRRDELLGRIEA